MEVTIVIPAYNRALLIIETLSTVSAQTSPAWECIIVDDFSTDQTEELVKTFIATNSGKFSYKKNIGAKGAQGARNTGILHAQNDYVMFLDSDDLLEPYCVEKRLEFMNANEGFDYYCFATNALLPNGNIVPKYMPCIGNADDVERFLKFQNPWHTMGCVMDKKIFDVIGNWDEELTRFQDSDLYFRLVINNKLRGCKACYQPYDSLFRAEYSDKSVSKSTVFDNKAQQTFFLYIQKVKSGLKKNDLWLKQKSNYLFFVFYIFSSFLMPKGALDKQFIKLYDEVLDDYEISAIKKIFYRIYFSNRGKKIVTGNLILKGIFKIIPKVFVLPHSKEMLW